MVFIGRESIIKKINRRRFNIKRIIFVLSALVLVSCLTFSAFAADHVTVDPTEDKIICSATLDDDFVPNKVIVLMSTESSLQFKDYTVDDFPELDLESVCDALPTHTEYNRKLFEDTVEEIDAYYEMHGVYTDATERRAQAVKTATGIMKNRHFHTSLVLTLKKSDKAAVLAAVRILEKRDDVYAAEPNYIVHVNLDGINGDADKDGDLTILDATHIQLYKAELIDESEIDLTVADYDEDGDVTILDATAIQRTLVDL